MQWFDVDKAGLGKLLERRGKSFVGAELLQNAWDAEGVTRVEFTAEPIKGRALVDLVVKDDSPQGFHNLTHSFTLFSESVKKGNATLRGRFNLGEKLVLALCDSATIMSTTSDPITPAMTLRNSTTGLIHGWSRRTIASTMKTTNLRIQPPSTMPKKIPT